MLSNTVFEPLLTVARRRKLASRSLVTYSGASNSLIFLVIEGSVSIAMDDRDGHEIVLSYLGPGELFGQVCLFGDSSGASVAARTRLASVIAEIDTAEFYALAARHPALLLELNRQLAQRLRAASRQVNDLAFVDVSGRIERTLGAMIDEPDSLQHPRGTVVRITRQELARRTGCSREMAGRVLKKLEEEGRLRSHGRDLLLLGVAPSYLSRLQTA